MQNSKPPMRKEQESEDARFGKSLLELRELRSQLDYAADYCETAFFNSKNKKKVVENTKKYICNAMVTVVDHLGCVSANLECLLNGPLEPSKTELGIGSLERRLLTCREYTSQLDIANVRWSANFPRYHPRHTSSAIPPLGRSNALLGRDATYLVASGPTYKIDTNKSAPLVPQTESSFQIKNLNPRLASGFEFSTMLRASDGPSILSKPRVPSFRSQKTKEMQKLGRHDQRKKGRQNSNFLPLLRRSKRSA